MQARSFVGTARRLQSHADATLSLPEATTDPVWTHGWELVCTIREFGELIRASAPLPYEGGADPTVDDAVASLLNRLYGWPYLPAVESDHPARLADRVDVRGDKTIILLSRTGPGVHNWLVLVRFLDRKLERFIEKAQRVRERVRQAGDSAPYAGVWETALSMLETTLTGLRFLWRRRRTVAQRIPSRTERPERFGHWTLEQLTSRDDA